MALVVLEAEELPWLECLRGHGRIHHHLDNIRREAENLMHGGAQSGIEIGHQGARFHLGREIALQSPLHHWKSLLGAGHGAYHVAGERRVKVAEEADGMVVPGDLDQ